MADEINKLVWITCPYCGASFRVGAPLDIKTIIARRDTTTYSNNFDVACPHCEKLFTVTYK